MCEQRFSAAFLKAGAAIGGGLMIGWVGREREAPHGRNYLRRTPSYASIGTAKVTVVSPMIEMGQGIYTSLPMLVAEELDVDMSNVTVEHSPPNDKLYGNAFLGGVQTTGNSSSIRAFYVPLRQAGAAARAMLIAAAAEKLNVDAARLTTEPGYVVEAAGKRASPTASWSMLQRSCQSQLTSSSRTPARSASSARRPSGSMSPARSTARRCSAST